MNKKQKMLAGIASLLVVSSTPVFAQDRTGGYVGINYAFLDTEFDVGGGVTADASTPVFFVSPGFQINPYFAIEGRLGFGVGDDNFTTRFKDESADTLVDFEVESYYGIFARVSSPVTNRVHVYGMAGYGSGKFESDFAGSSGSDEDIAYGVGLNVRFNDRVSGKVEYMNYYDEDLGIADLEVSGFALGLRFDF